MRRTLWYFLAILLLPAAAFSNISLPHFFGDHMVLQRDQAIRIWGWADPGEKVRVSFKGENAETTADKEGDWQVELPPMTASNVPADLLVQGTNEISISDILIGDVWICSGQSNMQWTVEKSDNGEDEIREANFTDIRIMNIPNYAAFQPQSDIPAVSWKEAVGENIRDFSAVGYFFGRHIYQSENIPIGLIGSNWGGTRAETWTSAEGLSAFDHTREALQEMKTLEVSYQEYVENEREKVEKWVAAQYPDTDEGTEMNWASDHSDLDTWDEIQVPGAIEEQVENDFDGIIWYKKQFYLPSNLHDRKLYLRLGKINDFDEVYINGHLIGKSLDPSTWRSYPIPEGILKKDDENILAIRVLNLNGPGGLVEVNREKFGITPQRWDKTPEDLSLAGVWRFKTTSQVSGISDLKIPKVRRVRPDNFPGCLFNGMIHPLIPLSISGVIWYQGESNTYNFEDAIRYREVFPNLINDWREKWGYDFPFYFVQLANFQRGRPYCDQPCEHMWPYLRESQTETLKLEKTGMAVTHDVGDPGDIHPRDKQSVGLRLGLIARANYYGDSNLVYSGPIYADHQIQDQEIWISFDQIGSGLEVRDRFGYLKGFQIAGKDQQFYWAKARVVGDRVVIWSEKVKKPVAVRYAWENNPEEANLYNREGLPASSFRTDNWQLYPEK